MSSCEIMFQFKSGTLEPFQWVGHVLAKGERGSSFKSKTNIKLPQCVSVMVVGGCYFIKLCRNIVWMRVGNSNWKALEIIRRRVNNWSTFLSRHLLPTETNHKRDQCQIFQQKLPTCIQWEIMTNITKPTGNLILETFLVPLHCQEWSFCHVNDWLFVPNMKQMYPIYNSSVAWMSMRLVIPPGSPEQSIPFSPWEEEQPGLLGHNQEQPGLLGST